MATTNVTLVVWTPMPKTSEPRGGSGGEATAKLEVLTTSEVRRGSAGEEMADLTLVVATPDAVHVEAADGEESAWGAGAAMGASVQLNPYKQLRAGKIVDNEARKRDLRLTHGLAPQGAPKAKKASTSKNSGKAGRDLPARPPPQPRMGGNDDGGGGAVEACAPAHGDVPGDHALQQAPGPALGKGRSR